MPSASVDSAYVWLDRLGSFTGRLAQQQQQRESASEMQNAALAYLALSGGPDYRKESVCYLHGKYQCRLPVLPRRVCNSPALRHNAVLVNNAYALLLL